MSLIKFFIYHSIQIIEVCITQSVPKCPQRFCTCKHIISARFLIRSRFFIVSFISWQMIIISRQMSGTLRKRESQFSGWIHSTKQYIRNGVAFLFSRIPLSQYCRHMFFHPRYGERFACNQYYNYRFPHSRYLLDKLFLSTC